MDEDNYVYVYSMVENESRSHRPIYAISIDRYMMDPNILNLNDESIAQYLEMMPESEALVSQPADKQPELDNCLIDVDCLQPLDDIERMQSVSNPSSPRYIEFSLDNATLPASILDDFVILSELNEDNVELITNPEDFVIVESVCDKCHQTFPEDVFNRHVSNYRPCDTCRIICCQNSLPIHVSTYHKAFSCNYCTGSFDTKNLLINHLAVHATPLEYVPSNSVPVYANKEIPVRKAFPFRCKRCLKAFKKADSLTKHMNTHKNEIRSRSNVFECNYCGREFNNKQTIKNHIWTHTGEKLFKCKVCLKSFRQSGYLTMHMRIHTGEHKLTCDICKAIYTTKSRLRHHIMEHMWGKSFICQVCNGEFSSSRTLRIHSRMHTGIGLKKCEFCYKSYTSASAWKKHLKLHFDPNAFKCDVCDKTFGEKGNLMRHKLRHTGIRIRCSYCSKELSPEYYPIHLRTHTGEKPHKCKLCDKSFTQSGNLKNHVLKHMGMVAKSLHCQQCSQSFSHSSLFKRHQQLVHNKPQAKDNNKGSNSKNKFQCRYCDKTCTSNHFLKNHERVHTNERPYECYICNKSFKQSSNLQAHQLTHQGYKPYNCEVCGKRFQIASKMKYHMITHKDERIYECFHCGKCFKARSNVKSHIMRIHAQASGSGFRCHLCDIYAGNKQNLNRHMQVHSKEFITTIVI